MGNGLPQRRGAQELHLNGISEYFLFLIFYNKKPRRTTGLFVRLANRLRQRVVDSAEGVTDLGSEQAHDCDYDDGDEGEDDCVLDETLTFFLGSE